MKAMVRAFPVWFAKFIFLGMIAAVLTPRVQAQDSNFHDAPASTKTLKNPYEGQPPAHAKALFHLRCARCHGENGEGSGNIPASEGGEDQGSGAGRDFLVHHQGRRGQWHAFLGELCPSNNAGRS